MVSARLQVLQPPQATPPRLLTPKTGQEGCDPTIELPAITCPPCLAPYKLDEAERGEGEVRTCCKIVDSMLSRQVPSATTARKRLWGDYYKIDPSLCHHNIFHTRPKGQKNINRK